MILYPVFLFLFSIGIALGALCILLLFLIRRSIVYGDIGIEKIFKWKTLRREKKYLLKRKEKHAQKELVV
jgi:hypothetical protein